MLPGLLKLISKSLSRQPLPRHALAQAFSAESVVCATGRFSTLNGWPLEAELPFNQYPLPDHMTYFFNISRVHCRNVHSDTRPKQNGHHVLHAKIFARIQDWRRERRILCEGLLQ
jgi:hypothetical protein